ncbi:adenylate/guanylate cyclase domain-containing protein [Aminobacter ciceronei]|uniref:Class 3 adenylate cyclase n=1 Tax=Aminobacter ciceronei TaxID=150723 RepID=A0ABR6C8G4_9HYPH|nr:adenylate/guanylate cyclase domain-containing protein [Aminobacter ciceronei]MBA8907504.1 class 3 adenylate cyclase [Aminobacter ciceronei]MBA9021234.1 class 3 adenylate cyclase [Aminobacter ciceronei]
MALADDIKAEVTKIFKDQWSRRTGQVVPEPESISLSNEAVEFEQATVLYADLSGSTAMVDGKKWWFAAEVYKTFLHCAAKLVRAEGGSITSYDGDRIMGVFIGDYQCTRAARCGLKINFAVQKIVNPALAARYPDANYSAKQVVGIDVSSIRAARTGVRGGNDIVWVGRAANYAAKLTDLDLAQRTWITEAVYNRINDAAKFGGEPKENMWKKFKWSQHDDMTIYGSIWTWRL